MLTRSDIHAKLLRRYEDFLRAWLSRVSFFPLRLPVGRLPDDFALIREYLRDLEMGSQRDHYRIELTPRRSKKWGQQDFPTAISIETAEDLLHILGKEAEFEQFQRNAILIRATLPQLEEWMSEYPQRIIEYQDEWTQLLEVCQFFLQNSQPGLFIRELAVSPHTKYIESRKSILRQLLDYLLPDSAKNTEQSDFALRYGLRQHEGLARLRLLDNQLNQRYGLALTDISTITSELNSLDLSQDVGIIVENKTTFLNLPPVKHAFAFFGSGYDVVKLQQIKWLQETRLLYWGDIDAQGFEILASFRRSLPKVQSILMDHDTFDLFKDYAVTGTPTIPIMNLQLTAEEQLMYHWLVENNRRLEQERVQMLYAVSKLRQVIDSL